MTSGHDLKHTCILALLQAEAKAAERARQLREEREKESMKFQGTWAASDSDEDGTGPLDLGYVPPVRVLSGSSNAAKPGLSEL